MVGHALRYRKYREKIIDRHAFTLIELLIVVAIIGILAAIAIPNFLNARIQAKIARAEADLHAISTAVTINQIDRNVLLVDVWDDDYTWGNKRIEKVFNNVGKASTRTSLHVLAPLTTPIAYLPSVLRDPFSSPSYQGTILADFYGYADDDPEGSGPDHGLTALLPESASWSSLRPLYPGKYIIVSVGPDGIYGLLEVSHRRNNEICVPFEASNGLTSIGDITCRSDG